MSRKYYIAFDTLDTPGLIKAVTVSVDIEYVKDMNVGLPINLAEDPLYKDLTHYVRNNPIEDFQEG